MCGQYSYTIRNKSKLVSIEVQLRNRVYYVKKCSIKVEKNIAWAKHGGAEQAWQYVKTLTEWDC